MTTNRMRKALEQVVIHGIFIRDCCDGRVFMCLPFIACIIKEVLCAYDKWIDFVCDAIYRRKSDDE